MQDAMAAPDSAPQWDQFEETISCPLCDYNLRGLAEPRCPECGHRSSWGELLRAAREAHETLFDHYSKRNVRNFFVTLRGGFLSASFWKNISPTLSGSRRRLLVYLLLCMVPCLMLVAGAGVVEALRYEAMVAWGRANLVASLSTPANATWANAEIAKYGSVQGVVNGWYPPWWRGRGLVEVLGVLWGAGGMLLAPAGTLLGMMIFQASMRRARIKQVHVLRCVVYSYDVFFTVGMVVLIMVVVGALFPAAAIRLPDVDRQLGIIAHRYRPGGGLSQYAFGAVMIVAGWRLGRAYHYYLRFDHAYWMAYSVQVIVTLFYAVLIVNGIV